MGHLVRVAPRARPWLLFGTGLLVALIICGWQASLILRFRSPDPTVAARVGESVVVGGVRYRVDTFETADRFPAAQPDTPDVTAMAGATLVKIIFTEEVIDPGRDLSTLYCDFTVHGPDDRRWSTASDIAYQVRMPEAVTCGGASEKPAQLRVPFEVGALFMVPADAADTLTFRIRLSTERELLEVRR